MPKTVTLHCEAGNHDWERVSVRGRRPVNCPEHGGGITVAKPSENARPEVVVTDAEVKALGLPRGVIQAFRALDQPIPNAEAVDRAGYSSAQVKVLDKHYGAIENI